MSSEWKRPSAEPPPRPRCPDRSRALLSLSPLILFLTACGGLPAGGEAYDPIVERLGSPDWNTREEAQHRLERAGRPALPALGRAEGHDDPEVQWRAREISRTIVEEEERRERARLWSISAGEEARARRASRFDLLLWRSERGHYSGATRLIPFFRTDYDRRRGQSETVVWPLGTRWSSTEEEFNLCSIPLLFGLHTNREVGEFRLISVPLIYHRSKAREEKALFLPPLLSGYADSPRFRVVSIFPILLHWIDKKLDSEMVFFTPLLMRYARRGDRFSVDLLFSLLFKYTYDPDGQEIRLFRFIRFRWGERPQAIDP